MKISLFILALALFSVSSFAKTCAIAKSSKGTSTFDQEVATYKNVDTGKTVIMTVIKKDGTIIKDIDLNNYINGVSTMAEAQKRLESLYGATYIALEKNEKNNQLLITIGQGQKGDKLLKARMVSSHDLNGQSISLMDQTNNLAVYCY